MAFHGSGLWSFDVLFARNVVIFGVENTSSRHSKSHKSDFLVLDEGPIGDINVSIGEAEKKFSTNFTKSKNNFCLRLHYNGDNNYLYVNERQICKFRFKSLDNICLYCLCLESVSKGFTKRE